MFSQICSEIKWPLVPTLFCFSWLILYIALVLEIPLTTFLTLSLGTISRAGLYQQNAARGNQDDASYFGYRPFNFLQSHIHTIVRQYDKILTLNKSFMQLQQSWSPVIQAKVCYTTSFQWMPASALSLPTVWLHWGNPGVTSLPVGYIPQCKVP